MAIEQWGFFSVPHLLRHGPTLYNGHLWGSLTLTPVADRLTVKLSLPVLLTLMNSDLPHARLRHRSGSYLDDNCFVRWPVGTARGYTPPYLSWPEVEHFYCGGTLLMPAPLRQPSTWSGAQWWQTRGNLKQRSSSSMSYMCQLDVKTNRKYITQMLLKITLLLIRFVTDCVRKHQINCSSPYKARPSQSFYELDQPDQ